MIFSSSSFMAPDSSTGAGLCGALPANPPELRRDPQNERDGGDLDREAGASLEQPIPYADEHGSDEERRDAGMSGQIADERLGCGENA